MDAFTLLAKITLDSSEFDKGLDSAERKASGFGSKLGGALGKVNGVVGGALKAGVGAIVTGVGMATTALGGLGVSSVKTGMEFDSAMSQVAATMGKTVSEMTNETGKATTSFGNFEGNLREFAQFLGKNTAFSATEAADALNYMALAGYSTQESMDMLPSVLSLAAAGGFELARASDMVTDTQTAFGLSAERTAQMVDEMAKAASTGNTSVEQLGDAFLTVGGLAQELNGGMVTLADGTQKPVDGVQELEIALTAMANAGVKGSEAGTHMRNMLLKLSSPTDAGVKQLKALGVSVFDTEGNMRSLTDIMGDLSTKLGSLTQEQGLQAISDLFNTRDIASAKSLLNAVTGEYVKMGEEIYTVEDAYAKWGDDIYDSAKGFEYVRTSWDEIGDSILEAEGAAAKMAATQLDNLSGDVTYLKSAWEAAKIAISDVLTAQGDAESGVRKYVRFATDAVSQLTDAFKEGGLSAAMDVFGTLLSEGLTMITKDMPKYVDAGIKLIGALGQGIMDNLDSIIDAASSIIEKLSDAIVTGLPNLLSAGSQILSSLLQALIDNLPKITPVITEFIVGLAQLIADNAEMVIDAAITIAGAIGEGLVQAAPILAEKAPEIIDAIVNGLKEHPEALLVFGPFLIEKLGSGISGAIHLLKPAIKGIGSLFGHGGELMSTFQTFSTVAKTTFSGMGSSISSALSGVGSSISSGLSTLGSTLSSGFSSIASFATADMGATMASGGAAAIGTAATAIIGSIAAFFGGAEIGKKLGGWLFPDDADLYEHYSGITGTLTMMKDFFVTIGEEIAYGWEDFTSGLSETWNSFKDGLASAWDDIKDAFSAASDFISEKVEGIKEFFGSLGDKFNEVKDVIHDKINGVKETFDGFRDKAIEVKDKVQEKWGELKDKTSEIWGNIQGSVEEHGGGIKGVIGTYVDGYKGLWEDGFNTIDELTGGKLGNALSSVTEKVGEIKGQFEEKWENIKSKTTEAFDNVKSKIEENGGGITGFFKTELDGWKTIFGDVYDNINELTGGGLGDVISTIQEKFGNIKEEFDGLIANALTWGKDMIDNFIGGIKDKVADVKDAVSNVASTVKDILGFSEPKLGPLSDFHSFAPDMMALFTKGVKDNTKKLQDQIKESFDFADLIVDPKMSAQSAMISKEMGGNSPTVSGITMNIYGAEGQDVKELADIVSDRILHLINQSEAVYA